MAPSLRPLPANPPRRSSRPLRASSTRVKTYREDSSDSDEVDVYDESSDSSPVTVRPLVYPDFIPSEEPQTERRSLSPSPRRRKPSGARITRSSSSNKKRALFLQASRKEVLTTSPKQLKLEDEIDLDMPSLIESANIPPWQTLPYHVLFDIFLKAAPMGKGTQVTEEWKSIRWLMRVSRLCKGFFEPAIAALYHSATAFSMEWLEKIRKPLELDQSTSLTNYRSKVKCLELYTHVPRADNMPLHNFLVLAPQLKHLQIRDLSDTPRKMSKPFQLAFLEKWFESTVPDHIQLQSWEWSNRMQLSRLKEFHLHPMLHSLRTVRFYRIWPYEPADTKQPQHGIDYPPSAELIVSSLVALPKLSVLGFTECFISNDFFFKLPVDLHTLTLTQCENVDTEGLASYLFEHGQKMEVLNLIHNKDIDMSFTVGLRASCPLLRVFRMDLNFSSGDTLAHDVEPRFELLLHPGQVPTWPSNLETLELERLRKWDITTAEAVFRSLIEAAPRLKYLRKLTLTAILKTDWRDRAQFRDEWARTLERTFLRRSEPPLCISGRNMKASSSVVPACKPSPRSDASDVSHLVRDEATDDNVPRRKSRRLAERKSSMSGDESARSSDGTSPNKLPTRNITLPIMHQRFTGIGPGMCNVVKIRIDNLRPADVILPAENLSDAEPSGDDDWNGDDIDFMNDEYAW
ncbi:hypothetical protein MGYG_03815 [Nannizzia gypsea CBS 118893]|uniref:Uncharacterized protein n=1 Tax=Arthroderma gypseum (strain ATCC MYA-4604 / CBS 118893) TaxID=535722 RepID=E4UU44_ARTGP|nr:hypothetical protein MGYG_03815 [Nannizzia gypsea CBS 118893]EFR00811.1 hypothetical protein MGYG_03815 [Nannizzia gypsea CBS 118893]